MLILRQHIYISQIELFHDQLPLAVPCYDLVPVTELTLGPPYGETSGTPGSLDLTGGDPIKVAPVRIEVCNSTS